VLLLLCVVMRKKTKIYLYETEYRLFFCKGESVLAFKCDRLINGTTANIFLFADDAKLCNSGQ